MQVNKILWTVLTAGRKMSSSINISGYGSMYWSDWSAVWENRFGYRFWCWWEFYFRGVYLTEICVVNNNTTTPHHNSNTTDKPSSHNPVNQSPHLSKLTNCQLPTNYLSKYLSTNHSPVTNQQKKYFQTSSTQNLYPNRFSHAADQSDQYIYPYPEILMLLLMFKNRPTEGKLRWLRFKLLYFFNSTSTVVNGLVHLSAHILCSQCNDQILLLHA